MTDLIFELKDSLKNIPDDEIPSECLGYYSHEIDPAEVLNNENTIAEVRKAQVIVGQYDDFLTKNNLFL